MIIELLLIHTNQFDRLIFVHICSNLTCSSISEYRLLFIPSDRHFNSEASTGTLPVNIKVLSSVDLHVYSLSFEKLEHWKSL